MIKNSIFLIYVTVILLIQMFYDYNVTVTQNISDSAQPGSEFLVEIVIDKGDIEGFGKIQQDLPDGFTASPNAIPGASFTFSDQKVKIIWMSLPSKSEFKISYKIKVDENVSGIKAISGKFSYLENSERHSVDIPLKEIQIGDITSSELAQDEKEREAATIESNITCNRHINQVSNSPDQFTIEISINKSTLSGFAKIQEILPLGFSATVIESKNAVFSFVDQKVKFVWMSLPMDFEYKVIYQIKNEGGNLNDLNTLEGEFAYLQNGETKKIAIVTVTPLIAQANIEDEIENKTDNEDIIKEETDEQKDVKQAQAISEKKEEEKQAQAIATKKVEEEKQVQVIATKKVEEEKQVQVIAAKKVEEEKQVQVIAAKAEEEEKQIKQPAATFIPQPSSGINYRVQIAAGHNSVEEGYFNNVYAFKNSIIIENHEGWIKYTTSTHQIYKSARDYRNDITPNYKFDGPFVTAYNNGKRITVQEALMITNQTWYK